MPAILPKSRERRRKACCVRAEEVEVRQVAQRQVLRRERPVQVVQVDAAQRAAVLREELVDLRRVACVRGQRELRDMLELRELQLPDPI